MVVVRIIIRTLSIPNFNLTIYIMISIYLTLTYTSLDPCECGCSVEALEAGSSGAGARLPPVPPDLHIQVGHIAVFVIDVFSIRMFHDKIRNG